MEWIMIYSYYTQKMKKILIEKCVIVNNLGNSNENYQSICRGFVVKQK
jgi:hypothetical protein